MKRKRFVVLLLLILSVNPLLAQDQIKLYLERARKSMKKGDCDSTNYYYSVYINAMNYYYQNQETFQKDAKVELFIKECNNPEPQTGFLIIEGNNSILSKSNITIIDEKGKEIDDRISKNSIWTKQELSVGEYIVQIKHDNYLPYEQRAAVIGGETSILKVSLEPNYANVTFFVDAKKAEIFFRNPKSEKNGGWENKGEKKWKTQREFGSYKFRCQKRGLKDSYTTVVIDASSEGKSYELNAPTPYGFFFTGNMAYNVFSPQQSYGFSFGYAKYSGGFFNLMYDGHAGFMTSGVCDAEGYLEDGTFPIYEDEGKESSRLSILVGGIWKPVDCFGVRFGGGYGQRNLYWKTKDGLWYRNLGFCIEGVDLFGGVQFYIPLAVNFPPIVISTDAVLSYDKRTFEYQAFEIKMGLGIAF